MTTLRRFTLLSLISTSSLTSAIVTPKVVYNMGSSLHFSDSENNFFESDNGEAYIFYGTFSTPPTPTSTAIEIESFFNQLGTSADVNALEHTFLSNVEQSLFENQRGYLIVSDNADISLASTMAIVSNSTTPGDWKFNSNLSLPALSTPLITPDDILSTTPGQEIILGNRDINGSFQTIKLQLVAVPEPPYASWVSLHGLSGDDALELSNPAGDGISNLMKYALRLDPNELVSAETDGVVPGKPAIIESGEGFKFTFLRNAEASDLTYSVQSCVDLSSWEPVTSGVSETMLSATLVKVTVLLPAGKARFCRLVVTK